MACPDCFRGFANDNAAPIGTEITLHGIRTYSGGHLVQHTSSSTIIFFRDFSGPSLLSNMLLADYFAAQKGCIVLVLDLIPGGAIQPSCFEIMDPDVTPVNGRIYTGTLCASQRYQNARALPSHCARKKDCTSPCFVLYKSCESQFAGWWEAWSSRLLLGQPLEYETVTGSNH